MKKRKRCGDIWWYAPKRKTPIAYSTVAASDLIVLLSQKHCTIQQVHDAIVYDGEAREILQKYIDAGHGALVARELFW